MLYQRRMRLPHVEDPTLNGTPLERMMLSLTSDGVTIGNAEPRTCPAATAGST